MNRWIITAALLALPACQVDPTATGTTRENATTGDCLPVANFCKAPSVTVKPWDGTDPPKASSTGRFELLFDAQAQLWTAYLAEYGAGTIPYAVSFDDKQLGAFVTRITLSGELDIVRVPGVPPVRHDEPFILESAWRHSLVYDSAASSADACKPER